MNAGEAFHGVQWLEICNLRTMKVSSLLNMVFMNAGEAFHGVQWLEICNLRTIKVS